MRFRHALIRDVDVRRASRRRSAPSIHERFAALAPGARPARRASATTTRSSATTSSRRIGYRTELGLDGRAHARRSPSTRRCAARRGGAAGARTRGHARGGRDCSSGPLALLPVGSPRRLAGASRRSSGAAGEAGARMRGARARACCSSEAIAVGDERHGERRRSSSDDRAPASSCTDAERRARARRPASRESSILAARADRRRRRRSRRHGVGSRQRTVVPARYAGRRGGGPQRALEHARRSAAADEEAGATLSTCVCEQPVSTARPRSRRHSAACARAARADGSGRRRSRPTVTRRRSPGSMRW